MLVAECLAHMRIFFLRFIAYTHTHTQCENMSIDDEKDRESTSEREMRTNQKG